MTFNIFSLLHLVLLNSFVTIPINFEKIAIKIYSLCSKCALQKNGSFSQKEPSPIRKTKIPLKYKDSNIHHL